MNEATCDLSKYSVERNLNCDYIELDEEIPFFEKMNLFIDKCVNMEYDYFLRSDADRIIFPGIRDLMDHAMTHPSGMVYEGTGYEYIMNRRRNATPHIYTKSCLEHFSENNIRTLDVLKPESTLTNNIAEKFVSLKTKNITNIHEYGLTKNRVFNCFLQRIKRNHFKYYDIEYIKNNLPLHYFEAICDAVEYYNNNMLEDQKNFVYVLDTDGEREEKTMQELKCEYDNLVRKYYEAK
jgi:hypothetical protein